MSSHETAYSETPLAAAKDTLATAIREVLQKDTYAARRAHQIHPHLRLKELNYVKNGYIAFVGFRRLAQIAVRSGASQTMNSRHIPADNGMAHAVDIVPYTDTDGNGSKEVSWSWPHYYPLATAIKDAATYEGVPIECRRLSKSQSSLRAMASTSAANAGLTCPKGRSGPCMRKARSSSRGKSVHCKFPLY